MKVKYEDGIFTVTDNNGITWKGDGNEHWEQVKTEQHTYVCDCSKCGFKYYTEIKQCNCPRCGCDGEHFRCTKMN